jgi:Superinfection immunity protein
MIYFAPTYFALVGPRSSAPYKGSFEPYKKNWVAIFALNLLLGWTVVGWVIALVWALTKDQDAVPSNFLARLTTEPDRPFETEAVLRGFPYRVRENGTVEAMMTGGLVHFRDMEQFRAAAEGRDAVETQDSASARSRLFNPNQKPSAPHEAHNADIKATPKVTGSKMADEKSIAGLTPIVFALCVLGAIVTFVWGQLGH